MSEPAPRRFRPNWLAIWATVLFLIVLGWLLGLLAAAPDGRTLNCPEEDMVQIVGVEKGVIVFCEDYRE